MAGYILTKMLLPHWWPAIYADPFSLLGKHHTETGLVVRALLPDASVVTVIEAKNGCRVIELNCDDPRGFLAR